MRKELPNTYTDLGDGRLRMKARTPKGEIVEYELDRSDLILDVNYTDGQGTSRIGRAILQPVVSNVIRVDKILPSGLNLFYLAALNCYSALSTPELLAKAKSASGQEIKQFLGPNILQTGHLSVVEHRGPSFLVEGISRACSHQFVRHRLLTFSQQSQRYLDFAKPPKLDREEMIFPFIVPPSIRWQPEKVELFLSGIRNALSGYFSLRAEGVFPEDARFLLPNAAATRLVVSGNTRVWLELIPKRACARAQWEIDMTITEIAHRLWQEMPTIFEEVGLPCSKGKCDQGKRSCGVPLNKPLSAFFEDLNYPHDMLVFGMR